MSSASTGGPTSSAVDPYAVSLRRGDAATIRRSLLRAAVGRAASTLLLIGLAAGVVVISRLIYLEG